MQDNFQDLKQNVIGLLYRIKILQTLIHAQNNEHNETSIAILQDCLNKLKTLTNTTKHTFALHTPIKSSIASAMFATQVELSNTHKSLKQTRSQLETKLTHEQEIYLQNIEDTLFKIRDTIITHQHNTDSTLLNESIVIETEITTHA